MEDHHRGDHGFERALLAMGRKLDRLGKKIDRLAPTTGNADVLTRLDALLAQGAQIIMSITLAREALAALNETTNTLAAAVETVVVADQAEDDAFRAEIQALKDQIAAGEAVTAEQLTELTEGMGGTRATLEAVRDALLATGSTPTDPIPVPEIPPVEPVEPVE